LLPARRWSGALRNARITSSGIGAIFPIAVVEANGIYSHPGDGLQQAKEYAQILGLKFAYATNGRGIVEHDFLTGQENDLRSTE
jgi:type I site-specific restriction endonuclease